MGTAKQPFRRRGGIAWMLSAVLLLIGLAPLGLMAWRQTQVNRVALATQETLGLPTSAIESDGRGASRPVASNETAQGRALNLGEQRGEVEVLALPPRMLDEVGDEDVLF